MLSCFFLWRREAAEVGGIGEKGPGVGGGDGEALGLVEFVEFHGGDTLVMDGAKRCLRWGRSGAFLPDQ